MAKIWAALALFATMHVLAILLVVAAARHARPGVRAAAWKYIFFGDIMANSTLAPEGLRLAARARAISWIAFVISAAILLFG